MKYALRKLIAFVFLGGIFWFIYQDLDNLDQPWFLHALGMIVVAFAFFWLLVPSIVVQIRIARRRRQNRERYEAWRSSLGDRPQISGDRPQETRNQKPETRNSLPEVPVNNLRISLESGEKAYWHEKGTLYVQGLSEAESWTTHGKPSDVAFPHFGRASYLQRTHIYLTNQRVIFSGKGLSLSVPFAEIKAVAVAPGGLVFHTRREGRKVWLAFTLQNPLIVRDVLARFLQENK